MKYLALGLAATASAALAVAAAQAGETTVVHEYKQVTPPPATETQTDQTATQATVQRTVIHHTVVRRHRYLIHHVARHTAPVRPDTAQNARATAVDASAVREQTTRTTDSAPPAAASPTVVERRTVIHRSDDGDVETHSRVIRQDSNGITTVEHHSTENDSGE